MSDIFSEMTRFPDEDDKRIPIVSSSIDEEVVEEKSEEDLATVNDMPTPRESSIFSFMEEREKLSEGEAKGFAKTAAGSLMYLPSDKDIETFSDKGKVSEVADTAYKSLITESMREFDDKVLAELRAVDPEGYRSLYESEEFQGIISSMQERVGELYSGRKGSDMSSARKALVQFMAGVGANPKKVHIILEDFEDTIKEGIKKGNPIENVLTTEVKLMGGVTEKQYKDFNDWMDSGSWLGKKGLDYLWTKTKEVVQDNAKIWNAEPLPGKEEDASRLLEFEYWDNWSVGLMSLFDPEQTMSEVGKRLFDIDEFRGRLPDTLAQREFVKAADKTYGKGNWEKIVRARFVKEVGIFFVAKKIGIPVRKVTPALMEKVIPGFAAKLNSSKSLQVAQRSVMEAFDFLVYSSLSEGANFGLTAVQGKEITTEELSKAKRNILAGTLMGAGLGVALGSAALAVKKWGEPVKEVIKKVARVAVDQKKKLMGESFFYTQYQKLPFIMSDKKRRLREYADSLKPEKIFTSAQEPEMERLIFQGWSKANPKQRERLGEMGIGPEGVLDNPSLLYSTQIGENVQVAAETLKGQNIIKAGQEANNFGYIDNLEKAFPVAKTFPGKGATKKLQAITGAPSPTNISAWSNEIFANDRAISAYTKQYAIKVQDSVAIGLKGAKTSKELDTALQTGGRIGELSPRELIGNFKVHPSDVHRYYAVRDVMNIARREWASSTSANLNAKGYKVVNGTLKPDGSQDIAKVYRTSDVLKKSEDAYTFKKSERGKEFSAFVHEESSRQNRSVEAIIDDFVQGDKAFVEEINLSTGEKVLRQGLKGRIVEQEALQEVTSPFADIPGYVPGYHTGNTMIFKLDKKKFKATQLAGGTEEGRHSGAISLTHFSDNYTLAKGKLNELNGVQPTTRTGPFAGKEKLAETGDDMSYFLVEKGQGGGGIRMEADNELASLFGSQEDSILSSTISEIASAAKMSSKETANFTEAVTRASLAPWLKARGKIPPKFIGKNKGAMVWKRDDKGKIFSEWDAEAAPYMNTERALMTYLQRLGNLLGEGSWITNLEDYFLKNYGKYLENPKKYYSNVQHLKIDAGITEEAKHATMFRILEFQNMLSVMKMRGQTAHMRAIGESMVTGARMLNENLQKKDNPLHQVLGGVLRYVENNPNLPEKFVHAVRSFTSLRLFMGNIKVAGLQLMPVIENSTYSMIGVKNLLDPALVIKDSIELFATHFTPGVKAATKHVRDLENVVRETGLLRDLRHAMPAGLETNNALKGAGVSKMFDKTFQAADFALYGAFRGAEGINRLVASSAVYRRMRAISKISSAKPKGTLKSEEVQSLTHWIKDKEGDLILSPQGKAHWLNETHKIAMDMVDKKAMPITNKGLFSLGFQYYGVLAPRLAERYIPGYGNTFSPYRQLGNIVTMGVTFGVGGPAFVREATEKAIEWYDMYTDPVSGAGARIPASVKTDRMMLDASKMMEDYTGIDHKELFKAMQDGIVGKEASDYIGTLKNALPGYLLTDLNEQYMQQGVMGLIPSVSQINSTAEGMTYFMHILDSIAENTPEGGYLAALSDPKTRPDTIDYLGDRFLHLAQAATYRTGVEKLLVASQIWEGEFDGKNVLKNGQLIPIPFPNDVETVGGKFKNFMGVWAGTTVNGSEVVYDSVRNLKMSKMKWAVDAVDAYRKMKYMTGDDEKASVLLNQILDYVQKDNDVLSLMYVINQAFIQLPVKESLPTAVKAMLDVFNIMMKGRKMILPHEIEIPLQKLMPLN